MWRCFTALHFLLLWGCFSHLQFFTYVARFFTFTVFFNFCGTVFHFYSYLLLWSCFSVYKVFHFCGSVFKFTEFFASVELVHIIFITVRCLK